MNPPYDHWQKYETRSGLKADLVISALQKEIRRGHVENAATLAYEMFHTSRELEDYLWFRLRTISVEDVGFGDVYAPVLIGQLDEMRRVTVQDGDRGLLAIHAVRYLCQCKKDRSSDEMYCWIQMAYERGTLKPEIPDYAYDKHTLEGQKMGRGIMHFYNCSSSVEPELETRDKTYRERVIKILEDEGNKA